MRLVDDSLTLVVAGSWNPSILSPAWVAKYALGIEGSVNVTIKAQMQGEGVQVAAVPSYSMPGLTYRVTPNALILGGTSPDDAGFAALHRIARVILEALPHTPTAAIGFNVTFEAENPDPQLNYFRATQDAVIDAVPAGWVAETNQVHLALSKDGNEMNVDRVLTAGTVQTRFNFHFPAPNAKAALEILDRNSFSDSFQLAQQVATRLNEEI